MNKKSLHGALLLVFSKGLSASIGLVSTLILARLLTPEDYGLVVLVDVIITVLAAVTELQMASVLIHLPSLTEDHLRTAWTLNFIRACVLATLVVLAAPLMVAFYEEPRLQGIAYVAAAALFVSALYNPKMALFIRDLDFKKEFLLSLIQKIAGFIVTVGIAWYERSYWALVYGTLATHVAGLIFSYWIFPFFPKPTFSKFKDLSSYSIWLTFSTFIKTVNVKLDQFVVGKVFDTRTAGVYSLGTRLSTVIVTDTLGAALKVISPSLRHYVDNRDELNRMFMQTQSLVALLFLPTAVIASALSVPFIDLMLGAKWSEVSDAFRFLILGVSLEAIGGVGLSVVLATLSTRLAFFRDVISFAARCAIMGTAVYLYGYYGLLWGRAVSSVLDLVLYFGIAARVTRLSIWTQLTANWRTLLTCALSYPCIDHVQGLVVFGPHASKWLQFGWLFGMGLFGVMVIVLIQGALWYLSGKPQGPELRLLSLRKFK